MDCVTFIIHIVGRDHWKFHAQMTRYYRHNVS